MKKIVIALLLAALMLGGCQKNEDAENGQGADAAMTLSSDSASAEEGETADEGSVSDDAVSGNGVSANDLSQEDIRYITCIEDNFENALKYIEENEKTENQEALLSIDLSRENYSPEERGTDKVANDIYKAIDEKIKSDNIKKLRLLREDKAGSTVDVTVYIDPSSLVADKLVAEEYCSEGRDISEYYFDQGRLCFAYEYKTDVYDTKLHDMSFPGKKCYFSQDYMTECVLDDEDVEYKNVSYNLEAYDQLDEFTKNEYDQLEKDMLNAAYTYYESVRMVPSTVLLSGYVGDEYGGVLSNVHMTISSKANGFSREFTTDGDGYFQLRVPANTADNYGVVCKYGSFNDSTLDDIALPYGLSSYSLGVIYMAEPGNNVHDANVYLLNANYSSPVPIASDELCITMTYEDTSVELSALGLDLKKQKRNTDPIMVIKKNSDTAFKYYVKDVRGENSGNPMTYEMSSSRALVRVYSDKGLVAAYPVPVNRAGTVWEVFEIKNDRIYGINNYFYETTKL